MFAREDRTLRRYLLGLATSRERDDIERGLLSDDAVALRLAALDDEMMVDAARNRLTPDEQRAFETAVQSSPARMRRLAEARALVDGIAALAPDEDPLAAVPDVRRSVSPRLVLALGTAVIVLGVLGWQLSRVLNSGPAGVDDARAAAGQPPSPARAAPTLATLRLGPRVERTPTTDSGPENVLTVTPETTVVRLLASAVVRTDGITRTRAALRREGGQAVAIAEPADVRLGPRTLDVAWVFAAAQIGAGAHRLVVIGETGVGASETLFEWSFTVARPSAGPGPADGGRGR